MKQGMSHVEAVLSFVLFIAAVSFSLFFLVGVRERANTDEQFAQQSSDIRAALTIPITLTSIIINDSSSGVIRIHNVSSESIVLNETYDGLVSQQDTSDRLVQIDANERRVYIVDGTGITPILTSLSSAQDNLYVRGSVDSDEVINASMMERLAGQLYEQTAHELALPTGVFMNLTLAYESTVISLAPSQPPVRDAQVYTTTMQVRVVAPEGALKYGTLVISLW